MTPWYIDDAVTVWHGDCLDVLADMADNSVDAVVTDPPAGIGFMGRTWDGNRGGRDAWIAWLAKVLAECLRVAKPGAHAYVWALPRTSGWTHRAVEDAGWEVRDCTTHLFGSGFPKSLNLGDGRGTALKPASEHWYLARKPLAGTVAQNVLAWGTGALNIDAARVGTDAVTTHHTSRPAGNWTGGAVVGRGAVATGETSAHAGRWPPNVALDPHTAAALDQQSGNRRSAGLYNKGAVGVGPKAGAASIPIDGLTSASYDDQGGASRFFPVFRYEPKAPTLERPRVPTPGGGLGTMNYGGYKVRCCDTCQTRSPATGELICGHDSFTWAEPLDRQPDVAAHPTVKPLDLMRWLVRLVTPPGGLVLDPFLGSGTTAEACIVEGFRCIGVERETAYLPMIRARLTKPIQPVLDLGEL